jgi:gamma-glutamylcyclotransferase (GGCT)/AIG2-like uncharacterized protein YtfP
MNRECDGTERVVVYGTLVEYTDNENEFVKNRRITKAFYTQAFIDNKTRENIPGYITITFNNYSTFTAIDNIDYYFYNIKIK